MADYIMTIDSETEEQPRKALEKDEANFDPEFIFDATGDPYADVINKHSALHDLIQKGSKPVRAKLIILRRTIHIYPYSGPSLSR